MSNQLNELVSKLDYLKTFAERLSQKPPAIYFQLDDGTQASFDEFTPCSLELATRTLEKVTLSEIKTIKRKIKSQVDRWDYD